ncbi:MAG: serine/threonine protein phosphatase [Pirellulales bacterium]|nr:serine/threonine protein phosphatase [Pirellulales bacterium]
MSGRIIAIGDIHGYSKSLAALIEAIDPQPADTLVPLGDYVDRGMDTKGVIELLIQLAGRCRLRPILGNHDEMVLAIRSGLDEAFLDWLSFGGTTTLYSYGCLHPREIPEDHIAFLESCLPYFETERHFFTHAGYVPDFPLDLQPPEVLRWVSLRDGPPEPHVSGKTAIVGHTAQKDREILDLGHVVCIDTHIYGGGWLTAMDVESRRTWQADDEGKLRE